MASPLVTRRNGKTQACEPCRRRKVACDHGYPVCLRCSRRRNGASMCYYLSPDQEIPPNEHLHSNQLARKNPSLHSGGHVSPEDKLWSSPAAREPMGFFGPTSFSAAYSETETSLAVHNPLTTAEQMMSSEATLGDETTPPSLAEIHDMAGRDQSATHIALRILQAIPMPLNEPRAQFSVHVNPIDEWMMIIGKRLLASTWETFDTYLRDRTTNLAKLREMSGAICINTRRVLKEDHENGLEWLESFSGPKLRWEAVGIMFLYAALGELQTSSGADSRRLIGRYTEYCSSCITLANMGGSSGSLMLFLLYKRSVLHACMHGDTSKRASSFWNIFYNLMCIPASSSSANLA